MRAIEKYLSHFDGNQTKAASALGGNVKQQHVWHWANKAKDMPVEYVPKAARLIGLKPCDLRPDIDW
jgi:DNA-binding transcriptional regulator YdaS (Cro superfamily)